MIPYDLQILREVILVMLIQRAERFRNNDIKLWCLLYIHL